MIESSLIAKPRMEYARPSGRKGGGLGILVFLAFLFFALTGGAYGGMYFYRQSLEKSLDGLTRELAQLEEDLDAEIIQEMARVDRGLSTARSLLTAHIYSSNLFSLLEDHTLADVYYNEFDYGLENGVSLGGRAKDFVVLHRQLQEFHSFPLVKSVTLEDIQLVDDNKSKESKENTGVDFTIKLILAENVFRFR